MATELSVGKVLLQSRRTFRYRTRRVVVAAHSSVPNPSERKYQHHDAAITAILSAIRELTNSQAPKRRSIGFTATSMRSRSVCTARRHRF